MTTWWRFAVPSLVVLVGCADNAAERLVDSCVGCWPRSWPHWPMPNPASAPFANAASLATRGAVAADNLTELQWTRQPLGPSAWRDASESCLQLALDGHDDWQLPTRIELLTLVDVTRVPTIDPTAFIDPPSDYFWTASQVLGRPGIRYSVYFGQGEVAFEPETTPGAFHLCVRPGKRRTGARFVTREGAVFDTATRLLWPRREAEDALGLRAGAAYCDELVLSGMKGFAVPTVGELSSLVPEENPSPNWPADLFEHAAGLYWTWGSADDDQARVLDFADGTAVVAPIRTPHRILCVNRSSHR